MSDATGVCFMYTVTSDYPTSTLASKWSKPVWMLNGPDFEWWSENWAKNVCFVVKNVWFLTGRPNQVIRPFEKPT